MAENIVINNSPPQSNSGGSSSVLGGLVRPIVTLITILSLIALVFALVLIVDNWEAIGVFFTTGFIGWLNPFDSPDGDTGPVTTATNAIIGDEETALSIGVRYTLPIIGPIIAPFFRR